MESSHHRQAVGINRRELLQVGYSGLLGIGLGIGLSHLVCRALTLPTIIPLWSPLVAFGVSAVVGLLSGSFPARRAALLDPIEALRHE